MRRKRQIKRETKPDPKYNSVLAAKFINYLMTGGKKSVVQRVFYNSLDSLAKVVKDKEPIEIFEQAIRNVSPFVEVRSRRIGGARYQVPREVRGERKLSLAIRWIVQAAHKRKGRSMAQKLSEELLDASKNTGAAVRKKEETHKIADANKAFAHFGW